MEALQGDSPSGVYERQNDKQQNLISITHEAQAHIVAENYHEIPDKSMIAICQHSANVGAGMWWTSDSVSALHASNPKVAHDGNLVGTSIQIRAICVDDASGGVVRFEAPLLDSVRALRDRANNGVDDRTATREQARKLGFPLADESIRTMLVSATANKLVFERQSVERTDNGPTAMHRMVLEAESGTTLSVDEHLSITANSTTGPPQLRMAYLTNIPPLTPYTPLELVTGVVRDAIQTDLTDKAEGKLGPEELSELQLVLQGLEDLSMLTFHEKCLAGGWRFLTYFGRDPMQVVHMLRPLLAPGVTENLLEAILARVTSPGEVVMQGGYARTSMGGEAAHEESIADQAGHERLQHAIASKQDPASLDMTTLHKVIYDYKMIDDDFMLVSLVADHLLDPNINASSKSAFLARINISGRSNGECLQSALKYISAKTVPYADSVEAGNPDPKLLVSLWDGIPVGDWRDSDAGLGRGRIPSSVNLTLVPTTLEKASRVSQSLGWPAEELSRLASAWESSKEHFTVKFSQEQLRERLRWFLDEACLPENRSYFASVIMEPGVTVEDFVQGRQLQGPHKHGLEFFAVSLDGSGQPIPVMTSDGFMGLIGAAAQPEAVERACATMKEAYPLGLGMNTGKLITNAAFVNDKSLYEIMGPGRYHGEIFWPWQMALAIAGLIDQEPKLRAVGQDKIADLAHETCSDIIKAAKAAGDLQTRELYAFEIKDGKEVAVALKGSADEAYDAWPGNNPQLWGAALPILIWARRKKLLG